MIVTSPAGFMPSVVPVFMPLKHIRYSRYSRIHFHLYEEADDALLVADPIPLATSAKPSA